MYRRNAEQKNMNKRHKIQEQNDWVTTRHERRETRHEQDHNERRRHAFEGRCTRVGRRETQVGDRICIVKDRVQRKMQEINREEKGKKKRPEVREWKSDEEWILADVFLCISFLVKRLIRSTDVIHIRILPDQVLREVHRILVHLRVRQRSRLSS